jgi:hypothetical protein
MMQDKPIKLTNGFLLWVQGDIYSLTHPEWTPEQAQIFLRLDELTEWQVKGKSLAADDWVVRLTCPRHKPKVCKGAGGFVICDYCHADLGWHCPTSPSGVCVYSEDLDHCDYCGEPEERK